MIDPKELRIGNWVTPSFDTESIIQVEEVTSSINCSPIPLTEEWLVKFGYFMIKKHTWRMFLIHNAGQLKYYIKFWPESVTHDIGELCSIDVLVTDTEGQGSIWVEEVIDPENFKYVHHLQNWYKPKTGEELTLQDGK